MASPRDATVDMAKALQTVFKKHTRYIRERGWKTIISPDGRKEVMKLVVNPSRPISRFRQLSFREWLEDHERAD